jgi:uncharacterized protein (DUF427 family)
MLTNQGNHYFPRTALRDKYVTRSDHSSHCFWKGDASYYNLVVGMRCPCPNLSLDGTTNNNAVWYYAKPLEGAEAVKDRIAFWKGVEIVD